MSRGIELGVAYMARRLGRSLDGVEPVAISPWGVIEILWPLNDLFRENIHQIRTLPYDPAFEKEADVAIEQFSRRPGKSGWESLSGRAWRVLLERHQQIMLVAMANEAAGRPSMTRLPHGLPEDAELPALMLLLLHGMKLPYEPEERSVLELPDSPPDQPLRRH